MDDNVSHAIEMTAAVFLFVFALSCAILAYNRISNTAENLILININNRRGTSTGTNLAVDEIRRKTDRSEIIMSVLNLDRMIQTTNKSDYKILVKKDGNILEYIYGIDKLTITNPETDEKVKQDEKFIGLTINNGAQTKYYLSELPGKYGLNKLVEKMMRDLSTSKYYINYTEDSIIYEKVN